MKNNGEIYSTERATRKQQSGAYSGGNCTAVVFLFPDISFYRAWWTCAVVPGGSVPKVKNLKKSAVTWVWAKCGCPPGWGGGGCILRGRQTFCRNVPCRSLCRFSQFFCNFWCALPILEWNKCIVCCVPWAVVYGLQLFQSGEGLHFQV